MSEETAEEKLARHGENFMALFGDWPDFPQKRKEGEKGPQEEKKGRKKKKKSVVSSEAQPSSLEPSSSKAAAGVRKEKNAVSAPKKVSKESKGGVVTELFKAKNSADAPKRPSQPPLPLTSQVPDFRKEKKAFLSAAAAKVAVSGSGQQAEHDWPRRFKRFKKNGSGSGEGGEEDAEQKKAFDGTLRDLHKLVLPHLEKGQRKRLEDNRLKALGAKVDRSEKMPYNMLMERKKKLGEQRQEMKDEDKILGVQRLTGNSSLLEAQRKKKRVAKEIAKKRQVKEVFRMGKEGQVVERKGAVLLRRKMKPKGGGSFGPSSGGGGGRKGRR